MKASILARISHGAVRRAEVMVTNRYLKVEGTAEPMYLALR
jgi:hypothetical protein